MVMGQHIGYCYNPFCKLWDWIFKYHEFTALHTWANKLAGIVLFATPILYWLFRLVLTGIIVCVVAMASACEELIIIIKSKELNRNCKGILYSKRSCL